MTDPFSAAGTAIGVVSLGLQVCHGVIQFYDAWRSQDADVRSTCDLISSLEAMFASLRAELEKKPLGESNLSAQVKDSIGCCENDVAELQKRLTKVQTKAPDHSSMLKLGSLDAQRRRLLYPFRQGTLGKFRDVVLEMRNNLGPLLATFNLQIGGNVLQEIRGLRAEQAAWKTEVANQLILRWLSPLAFHERHASIASSRNQMTCTWVLSSDQFKAWQRQDQDCPKGLWCQGRMGSGKSNIAAFVVDHLSSVFASENVAIVNIYCDWQDSRAQTAEALLGSLLRQLAEKFDRMPTMIGESYEKHRLGAVALSLEDISQLLESLAQLFQKVFICIDGLDECGYDHEKNSQSSKVSAIEEALTGLSQRPRGTVSVFVTSRFGCRPSTAEGLFSTIEIEPPKYDLCEFVTAELSRMSLGGTYNTWLNSDLGRIVNEHSDMFRKVATHCVEQANGTFLLPRLRINLLKQQINLGGLQKVMNSDELTLADNIAKALQRLQSQPSTLSELAKKVLTWISTAIRPLKIEELQIALALEGADSASAVADNIIPESIVSDTCAGLVEVDATSGVVRFIHYSVKHYLDEIHYLDPQEAHTLIVDACVAWLLLNTTSSRDCLAYENVRHLLEGTPFLAYAAQYWGDHIAHIKDPKLQSALALPILRDNERANFTYRVYYAALWKGLDECPQSVTGLHLAAFFGLRDAVTTLSITQDVVNAHDSRRRAPLYLAACRGYVEIIRDLIDRGAELKGRGESRYSRARSKLWWYPAWARGEDSTPAIEAAVEGGHTEAVELLLEKGAEFGLTSGIHSSSLEAAVFKGHIEITRLLLSRGAPVSPSTLQASVYNGDIHTFSLLLDRLPSQALEEAKRRPGPAHRMPQPDLSRALYASALANRFACAKELLDRGVSVNRQTSGIYNTALQAAASQDHLEMMRLLIEGGADVNVTEDLGDRSSNIYHYARHGCALQAAAHNGKIAAARMLIEAGAEVNVCTGHFGTPLQAAAVGGHLPTFQLLLEHGAQIGTVAGHHGTALHAAASEGHTEIVHLLIDLGADVNAEGGDYGFALQAAARNGDVTSFRLLLNAGADPFARSGRFDNALQAATGGIPSSIFKHEARKYADEQIKDAAAFTEYEDFFQSRRDAMRFLQHAKGAYGSLLRHASGGVFGNAEEEFLESHVVTSVFNKLPTQHGRTEIVRVLLDLGLNPNMQGGRLSTPLKAASFMGRMEIVRMLLEVGADPNMSRQERSSRNINEIFRNEPATCLESAIKRNHVEMVRELLKSGADCNAVTGPGRNTPLHFAASKSPEITRLLLDRGAKIQSQNFSGAVPPTWPRSRTGDIPLDTAIRIGNTETVRLLLHHPKVVIDDALLKLFRNCSLLDSLREFDNAEVTLELLAAGPTKTSVDEAFRLALKLSTNRLKSGARRTHITSVRYLIDHGADVDAGKVFQPHGKKDKPSIYLCGVTEQYKPLLLLVRTKCEDLEFYKLLLGAISDHQEQINNALWYAANQNLKELVSYLLATGAIPTEPMMNHLRSRFSEREIENLDRHSGITGPGVIKWENEANKEKKAKRKCWLAKNKEILGLLQQSMRAGSAP